MCDFSLQSVKSRAANVGDKLVSCNFGTGTSGFAAADDTDLVKTAVCVLPGTEIAFDENTKIRAHIFSTPKTLDSKVARFRQINRDNARTHHDALEFPDGQIVLLNDLAEGQAATVLQLPATPKTEEEAKEQTRLEMVG